MLIETNGLRVELEIVDEECWEVLKFAAARAAEKPESRSRRHLHTTMAPTSSSSSKLSNAEGLRQVARELLSDGRFHPRKELARAAREAGLNANHLESALRNRFERNSNIDGTVYRDPEAVREPVEIENVGSLNGGSDG